MSNGQLLSMVSFDNKFNPIDGAKFYEKDGYKFMPVKRQSKIIKLKHLELYCKAENRDIPLDYAKMPNLQNQILSNKELSFFNYCTKRNDSITFIFSNAYNRYYNDLPRIIPDHHYYMAPVSPAFQNSFFAALDGKMGQCHTRLDSINFLLKLVQTAVQFEEDQTLYGKKDWCSFPENTFALGKGDCEDKSEAFAFLISHYFNKVGIVFLYYANHIGHINHVRVGLNDPNLPLVGRPCKEFEGKSYFEAELQSDDTVLADDFFAIFYETPQFFRK
jgi:predicted transglutaminase-like cysteine proteinase